MTLSNHKLKIIDSPLKISIKHQYFSNIPWLELIIFSLSKNWRNLANTSDFSLATFYFNYSLFFSFSSADLIISYINLLKSIAFFDVITDYPVFISISLLAFPAILSPSLATFLFSSRPCGCVALAISLLLFLLTYLV